MTRKRQIARTLVLLISREQRPDVASDFGGIGLAERRCLVVLTQTVQMEEVPSQKRTEQLEVLGSA